MLITLVNYEKKDDMGFVSIFDVRKILEELKIDVNGVQPLPNNATYIDKITRKILCKHYGIPESECKEKLDKQPEFVANYRTVHEIIRKKVVSKEYPLP